MNPGLLQFATTAFVMLFVVINPIAVAPVFVAVTSGMEAGERRSVLTRGIVIAFGVALFFLFVGRTLLSYLGVTMHAFAVSGGVLLFLIALPMLFGQRSPAQSSAGAERRDPNDDAAVFPMAIPMLAGPGTIATVLVLAAQAENDATRLVAVVAALASVYLLAWPILTASDRVIARIGAGRVGIVSRVLGIILAALAVQYVFNGITGFYDALVAR
jgi:multiple antibiotic resistance protein